MGRLERLGLISFSRDEHGATDGLAAKRIYRSSVITVGLHSLDATFSEQGEKKEAVLFQLLHGAVLPLMCSLSASRAAVSASGSASPTTSPIHGSRSGEEVSVDMCLALLRQWNNTSLNANTSACRFVTDLVNEALLVGVRGRLLHPCGNGSFRLHHDLKRRSSPCLLAFQCWWMRRVDTFLRRTVSSHAEFDKLPLEAFIDTAQARVRHLIDKKDEDLPQFLLCGPMDAAMALVADAVRCWVPPPLTDALQTSAAVPQWQLHLSDEAKVSLALETVRSVQSCLARRPAGVSLSELSQLISWPLLSSLLGKKSLLKTLKCFPSVFAVATVQGVSLAQLQLQTGTRNDVDAAEAAAWVLTNQSKSPANTAGFLQEVDLVVRALTFLRKRHLRQTLVTFEELSAAVLPSKESSDGASALLDVLCRYDIVASFDTDETVTWASVQQKVVQLSSREVCALRTMEAFRKKTKDRHQLYAEAVRPFLSRCKEELVAGGVKDAVMPIELLERWLQTDRLFLRRTDLLDMLRSSSSPFVVDDEGQTIFLGHDTAVTKPKKGLCTPPAIGVTSHLTSPPPPPVAHCYRFTFDSQLARVLNSRQIDALLHFVETTIHAVFVLLLPQLSAPSGVRLQSLLRRVRWGSVAPTLGSLPSFVEAFDGLFFDLFSDTGSSTEDIAVATYRGPVNVWLLYARLVARLFPLDADIPLRVVAEGLSWNVRFASRFGDLPSLLRRVGRSCRGGYLLAKKESVAAFDLCNDLIFWELVEKVRQLPASLSIPQEPQQQEETRPGQSKDAARNLCYVLLKPSEFSHYLRDTDEVVRTNDDCMRLAENAVRRFPSFFQWHTATDDPSPLLRIARADAPAPCGLVSFVEEYVCPLLREHPRHGVSVAELDDRLGWSGGWFDAHPAGVAAVAGVASVTSLFGILRRYVEAVRSPWLLLMPTNTLLTGHGEVMVRPNTDIYHSPEDMLLRVNGLERVAGENGLLRPSGRPVSLFEVLAEEQELRGDANTATVPRTEQWHVSLQCEGKTFDKWEEKLAGGKSDVLVWCET